MKFNSFKKIALFISSLVLFILFIVSLSGAEQSDNELTKEVFSVESLKTLKGPLQDKGIIQAVEATSESASSFDVKIHLNERFNAIFSFGDAEIRDLSGRYRGKNYNALCGFQLRFQ